MNVAELCAKLAVMPGRAEVTSLTGGRPSAVAFVQQVDDESVVLVGAGGEKSDVPLGADSAVAIAADEI